MFERLRKVAVNATKLNLDKVLGEIWRDPLVQDYIIEELNQMNQLRKGQKTDGSEVGFYRSDAYAELKKRVNKLAPLGVVDLLADGDFYSTFDINILPKGFEITANTNLYDEDFNNKYGPDILGLSEDSKEKLRQFIKPILLQKIREKLQSL